MILLQELSAISNYRRGERKAFTINSTLKIASALFLCVWAYTLTDMKDPTDWMLENIPVFFWIGVLWMTYKNFRFSDKSYILIFIFLSLHIYGAKDIYEHNALGNLLKELTGTTRNNYDRIVHFSFGMFISYAMLDLFTNYFKWKLMRSYLGIVVLNLAFGAFYEILEWIVAAYFFPEQGGNFLGMQGDVWDSQKDMFLQLMGAMFFVIYFIVMNKIKINYVLKLHPSNNNFSFEKNKSNPVNH
jgi:putative membrane protein